ncbi:MAG: hypothetical protein H0V48_06780 [Nocardioidaceae bacterium]|nr:hypothetical protein [Nocardioidaceae bacterium]MDQ3166615.1 hypothetical protein [Actinomycetota bacterium]
MSRRVSLPGADELFRPTRDEPEEVAPKPPAPALDNVDARRRGAWTAPERTSGRVKHDEKMTVYVTSDELIDLEHARLVLRREAGIAVDRGRLVREAVAIALADIEERGPESEIVRRLADA